MMTLLELFWSFLQVGLFSIGGGYAAMPLIQAQVVEQHPWLTMSEFTDLITIAEMTPGPIAINSATFVGIRIAGLGGAVVATFGCILPSLLIVSILAKIYYKYKGAKGAGHGAVLPAAGGCGADRRRGPEHPRHGALWRIGRGPAERGPGGPRACLLRRSSPLRKLKWNPILVMSPVRRRGAGHQPAAARPAGLRGAKKGRARSGSFQTAPGLFAAHSQE